MSKLLVSTFLGATLALTPVSHVDAKKSSVAGAIAWALSKRSAVKTIPKAVPKRPSLLGRTWDLMKSGASTDDFYSRLMLTRAAVWWAQFLALTPTTIDAIASAQYGAMMWQERVLPESHPTVRRVREITSRLTRAVESNPDIPKEIKARMHWEVKVIEKNVINAFCMPGGKMAIYTEIINKLRLSDDEIAVIMGHEIAHALKDHGYQRIRSQVGTNAMIALAWAKTGSLALITAADVGNSLWQLSHSRDHEREADSLWLELVRRAGYDVCAWEKVWKKMWTLTKSTPPKILSTHPPSNERQETLHRQAENMWKVCR